MKELCDIKTIAEYLNVSVPYIRKLVYSKKIPHYKIGSRLKFDIKDICQEIPISHCGLFPDPQELLLFCSEADAQPQL